MLIAWVIISLSAGAFFVVVIPLELPSTHKAMGFVARSGIIGGLIVLISFWLGKRPVLTRGSVRVGHLTWLWYAIPCFVVWTIYLLAFWPGSMSPDSLYQWKETLTGRFTDWHPAFHTMNIWLINHLWTSPAAVAFAQIFALGSIAGWGLASLRRLGISGNVIWIVGILFAFSVVNGLMVITLWKDIAYSISVLALTLLVLRILTSEGQWMLRGRAWLILAFVSFLVASYRYNGIITGYGTLLILLVCYPRFWRRITLALILSLVLFFGIRGPLYALLDVDCTKRPSITSRLPTFIKTKTPPSSDRGSDHSQKGFIATLGRDLRSGSQIWRIKPFYDYFKRIEYVNIWKDAPNVLRYINSNKLGVASSSMLPEVKDLIFDVYQQSIRPPLYYFIWSPAFYLYIFLASVAIASIRAGSWKFLFLSTPIVLHVLQFVVMQTPGQKLIHRYHYPVILVSALLSIPMLFLNKKTR